MVKAVGYKLKHNKTKDTWSPPKIEDEIKKIMDGAITIGERHYPDPNNIKDGVTCAILFDSKTLEKGTLFTICSYTKGLAPEAVAPDMESTKLTLQPINLQTPEGKKTELAFSYRCLAFGQIILIESVQGAGGITLLCKLLTFLLKKYSDGPYSSVELYDIASTELRDLIQQKGGVKKITASLVHDIEKDYSNYASQLSEIRNNVKGTNKFICTWEAEETKVLDEEATISLFDEAESEFLDSIMIKFKDNSTITGLHKYKEKRHVQIQLTPEGKVATSEIETELKRYLKELRDPRNKSLITTEGFLKNVKKKLT